MAAEPRIFISHTTRDERDHALARQLADGLRMRGAKVWIAPESIPAGDRWDHAIVAAILDGCSHFLVILSAASTGADWVLREIELARGRAQRDPSFRVLPLTVGALGDFSGKDFIDARQRVPYHQDLSRQLEAVAAAMGLRPAVAVTLPPTAADPEEFVGREYVFAAIDGFLGRERQGYFVIEGDPGAGKSAILAEFVRRLGCIAHFNVRALGVTTARQFLNSVCAQLIARYGLDYPTLPPEAIQDGAFLSKLLNETAEQLDTGEKLVVAVDALDEVDLTEEREGANVLYLPSRLPDGVHFVLTRRKVAVPFTVQAPQELYDLGVHREETRRDVRAYTIRATAQRGIRDWLSQQGLDPDAFVTELVDRSQENFMYLRYVLPEIERGRYGGSSVEHLPRGLEGYYEDHWRQMGMRAKPLPVAKIRVVCVLSEVHSPVSRGLITRFVSDGQLTVDEVTVQEVLNQWDQFLHEQTAGHIKRYSLYHASFRDFLHRKDIVQAARVTIEGIHELIADTLWDDLSGNSWQGGPVAGLLDWLAGLDHEQGSYTLESLVSHLAAAGNHDRLRALFADDQWMRARFEASGQVYDDYLADLALAWEQVAQPAVAEAIERGEEPATLADCFRYALIQASLNSLSGNYPPELVARAVEMGMMKPERALSIGRHVPDPAQRAHLHTRLLSVAPLTGEQREAAQRVAIDAVRAIGYSSERTEALAAAVPHLPPGLAPEALEVAMEVENPDRSRALAAVAPLLDGEARRDALRLALQLTTATPSYRLAETWAALAACLDSPPLLGEALRIGRQLPPEAQALALVAIGSRADEPDSSQIFAEALAALRRIAGDEDGIFTLARAVARFDGPARREATTLTLDTALRLPPFRGEGETPQMVGLRAVAPFLKGKELDRAVTAALAIPDIAMFRGELVETLAALAGRLQGGRRQKVLKAALGLAQMPREKGFSEGSWEVRPLLTVAPLLDGEERIAVLRTALDRALGLPPLKQQNTLVNPRAEALAMVAPHLSGDLLEEALRSAADIDDTDARAIALATMASFIDRPARIEIARAAVQAMAHVANSGIREGVVVACAPLLPTELLGEALDAAAAIDWDSARGDALAALNSALPPALARRALDIVAAIEFEPARADALTALAKTLPEDLLEPALEAAWSIDWEPGRTQAVAALAPPVYRTAETGAT